MPKNLAGKTKISKPSLSKMKCQYCNKEFKKESTLQVHTCTKGQRWKQQNHYGVRLGFTAWLRFFEMNVNDSKKRTYGDFVESPYYSAFVKFGNFMESIRCINPISFTEWILNSNIKIDNWCKDSNYDKWLVEYTKKEHASAALERFITTAETWAEANNAQLTDYFRYGNANKICQDIATGKTSPWVVFNSKTGVEFLDGLIEDQIQFIFSFIDPDHWKNKFATCPKDVDYAKEIMDAAGF
jgi:hypothetical protein